MEALFRETGGGAKEELSGVSSMQVLPIRASLSSEDVEMKEEGDDRLVLESSMCFRCGKLLEGERIACDKLGCTNSYHLSCLDISKLPHGMFLSPTCLDI